MPELFLNGEKIVKLGGERPVFVSQFLLSPTDTLISDI
jgi:hypothetical protein